MTKAILFTDGKKTALVGSHQCVACKEIVTQRCNLISHIHTEHTTRKGKDWKEVTTRKTLRHDPICERCFQDEKILERFTDIRASQFLAVHPERLSGWRLADLSGLFERHPTKISTFDAAFLDTEHIEDNTRLARLPDSGGGAGRVLTEGEATTWLDDRRRETFHLIHSKDKSIDKGKRMFEGLDYLDSITKQAALVIPEKSKKKLEHKGGG